ncbi:MAG: class I SAM-dependent methyltransferase [Solirubrobacteraceae bacterium]
MRLTLREPGDGLDRAVGRARRLITGSPTQNFQYRADPDWERHLHERLGQPWPCQEIGEFQTLWSQVTQSLQQQGLSVGRGAYGGWDDGDQGFARAVYCLTRHLRASSVVETGVARGITSRVILEALQRDGDGRLASIDLPALDTSIHSEIAAAVPSELRARWTYVNGTSRRRLPPLLAQLGEIDLFVHDSSHTTRNVRFELEHAWGALRKGAIVADDIERNEAFGQFTRARPDVTAFVAAADDSGAQFGILLKGL